MCGWEWPYPTGSLADAAREPKPILRSAQREAGWRRRRPPSIIENIRLIVILANLPPFSIPILVRWRRQFDRGGGCSARAKCVGRRRRSQPTVRSCAPRPHYSPGWPSSWAWRWGIAAGREGIAAWHRRLGSCGAPAAAVGPRSIDHTPGERSAAIREIVSRAHRKFPGLENLRAVAPLRREGHRSSYPSRF